MRRGWSCFLFPLLLVTGSQLEAQSPHLGFSLNLLTPTGDFASTTYPAYFSSYAGHVIPPQKETYDVGLGASFTASWPVDRKWAWRLNVSASSEDGHNRAAGEADINLRHTQMNLGGDLQFFPGATAFQHRGLYFVGGLSADFERFDRSFGDVTWDATDTSRKSRLGASVGLGHSFGYASGMRFTLEATFHKTLTGHDVAAGDPPSSDFAKVAFGWVF